MIRNSTSLSALAGALLYAGAASGQTVDAPATDGTESNTAIVVTGSSPTRSSKRTGWAERVSMSAAFPRKR